MFRNFLPREASYFDFFEKHAAITIKGALALQHLLSNNGENRQKAAKEIKDLEHQADQVAHLCIEELNRTFITPLDRDDIFNLISRMDDIIDSIEDASSRIDLYKITVIRPDAQKLGDIIVSSVQEIEPILKELRNLKNADEIRKRCVNINKLENEGDRVVRNALANLFDEEQDTRLLIKWKEIYDYLEDSIDRCEDVANVIEGVVMEMA